ncbi:MAG: hypothetical protein ACK559_07970, partial [bacterium]
MPTVNVVAFTESALTMPPTLRATPDSGAVLTAMPPEARTMKTLTPVDANSLSWLSLHTKAPECTALA